LKAVLKADADTFARCLTEKMLTYALGRGLERYDRPAVQLISRNLGQNGYKFSHLIFGIVESLPFQMRRGDGGKAMITQKRLARRTFLRGLGTAIALPFLDAMSPAMAAPRVRSKPVVRMAFVYVPNGIIMPRWTPAAEGAGFDLPMILEPLAERRQSLTVFTGLSQVNGRALGDGPGDHARAASTFLTGVHPRKTAGADIQVGVSVDQVAAQAIGGETRFASLELGLEHGRLVGNCDSGYSCAYSNSVSWRTPSQPNPPEVNPRLVFERLFAGFETSESPAARARRQRYEKSILDFVAEDTVRLQGELGATDRRKLDEYLTGVREIERRIETAEKTAQQAPPIDRPEGIPVDYSEHARLMFDLMAVAFQTDSTRIASFMMAREGSNRAYGEIGISDAHHGMSHHRGNQEWIDKLARINRYHIEQFAYFLSKLEAAPDVDGSLLDNSLILYGSGLADGNRHTHHDLPVLLAGRGARTVKAGRHLRYASETPMNNLFLSILDRAGVAAETLGDSTGKLRELTEL
jgi:hypothetical protein